jgi:transposase/transposase-like protein
MYTKQEIIIQSYREGKSQRAISQDLQISRKTVKKYIELYENRLQDGSNCKEVQSDYLSKPPVYNSGTRSKLKLTREVQQAIDELLEENHQNKQKGFRKQLLKKCDILAQLHKQGFDIGYTTVCNYIRKKTSGPNNKEAFIRQVYSPGVVCEFDWGEIKLIIGEKTERLQLAVFTSAYSNYRFADFYHRQDTLSFMESHVSFIDHTGGVYQQMVYDNTRVAVSKFVGPHEKEPTQALLQLRGHYGFTHRFCNVYRGNEKGHVERSVEYIRRKTFGIKNRFSSIDQAREWLTLTINKLNATRQVLTGKTAFELFNEEKAILYPAHTKMICYEAVQLRVDKYATISFKTNRYSVPDHLVGNFVDARILSHTIEIYHDEHRVALHQRSYQKHQWIINIEHFLDTFKKKPGALPGSQALASSVFLKHIYEEYFVDDPRGFIDLLDFCYKNRVSDEKIEQAVSRLINSGTRDISIEKIKALLGNKQECAREIADTQTTSMAKKQLAQAMKLIN